MKRKETVTDLGSSGGTAGDMAPNKELIRRPGETAVTRTRKAEAEGPVQDQPKLHSEFEASLG